MTLKQEIARQKLNDRFNAKMSLISKQNKEKENYSFVEKNIYLYVYEKTNYKHYKVQVTRNKKRYIKRYPSLEQARIFRDKIIELTKEKENEL